VLPNEPCAPPTNHQRLSAPRAKSLLLLGCLLLLSIGCHHARDARQPRQHLGPKAIVADRVPYNNAINDSWKAQTLLNIVKTRYLDPPFFTDVPQIVSGYSFDRTAGTDLGLQSSQSPNIPSGQRFLALFGLSAQFTDRPTVSYSPQTDPQFVRNLTAPLPTTAVVSLLDAGYGVDAIFNLSVQGINGRRNSTASGGVFRPADAEYHLIAELIGKVRRANSFEIRISGDALKDPVLVAHFRHPIEDPQLAEDILQLKQLLGLDPELNQFPVVYGSAPAKPNEIAIHTRPIYLILRDLSPFVSVPEQHVLDGRAIAFDMTGSPDSPPLNVCCGCDKPVDAFAAVQYGDYWFWIEQGHFESKRTFIFLRVLLALADTRGNKAAPTVTIQAN
jgi:hypothetical protein